MIELQRQSTKRKSKAREISLVYVFDMRLYLVWSLPESRNTRLPHYILYKILNNPVQFHATPYLRLEALIQNEILRQIRYSLNPLSPLFTKWGFISSSSC